MSNHMPEACIRWFNVWRKNKGWNINESGQDDIPTLPIGAESTPMAYCLHDWKTYNSGWNIYHYCEKCNAEKPYEYPVPEGQGEKDEPYYE